MKLEIETLKSERNIADRIKEITSQGIN